MPQCNKLRKQPRAALRLALVDLLRNVDANA